MGDNNSKNPQYPNNNVSSNQYGQQYPVMHHDPYSAAPPPYSEQPPYQPQHPSYGQNVAQHNYAQNVAQHSYAQNVAPPSYQANPQNIVVQGVFDADARFGNISQATIPPPPPGCAPNAAQIAISQGHNVVGTQQSTNWVTGSTGGGVCFGL